MEQFAHIQRTTDKYSCGTCEVNTALQHALMTEGFASRFQQLASTQRHRLFCHFGLDIRLRQTMQNNMVSQLLLALSLRICNIIYLYLQIYGVQKVGWVTSLFRPPLRHVG
jgi:hypothetical protein